MMREMWQKIIWWVSGWWPVGIITYRQARRLAENVYKWREIAENREKYPIGDGEDRRESIVYGNCAGTIESTLGLRRMIKWQARYGDKRF